MKGFKIGLNNTSDISLMVSEPQGVDNVSQKYDCQNAVGMATIGRLIDSPAIRM